MTPVDPAKEGPRGRPDFLGWICLVLLLLPYFWLAAPAVVVVCGLRTWRLLRADCDVPNPTLFALMLGVLLSLGWVWYFGSLMNGRVS